ncbi:hemK methyltransferase family member 2 [Cryptosporidium felis]|nr:hemK methyltransferase family member 2 [Cryptosporidium felis]
MVNLGFTRKGDWEEVYEPSEDTFLMEDALRQERESILRLGPRVVCELGCGSGYLTASLLEMLRGLGKEVAPIAYMIDVNRKALDMSERMITNNIEAGTAERLQMSLFSNLKRGGRMFDLVVFNPPYVPSSDEELARSMRTCGIDCSWSGGADGLFFVSRFLFGDSRLIGEELEGGLGDCLEDSPCLADVLAPGGICLLLLELRNRPGFVLDHIQKDPRYSGWEYGPHSDPGKSLILGTGRSCGRSTGSRTTPTAVRALRRSFSGLQLLFMYIPVSPLQKGSLGNVPMLPLALELRLNTRLLSELRPIRVGLLNGVYVGFPTNA